MYMSPEQIMVTAPSGPHRRLGGRRHDVRDARRGPALRGGLARGPRAAHRSKSGAPPRRGGPEGTARARGRGRPRARPDARAADAQHERLSSAVAAACPDRPSPDAVLELSEEDLEDLLLEGERPSEPPLSTTLREERPSARTPRRCASRDPRGGARRTLLATARPARSSSAPSPRRASCWASPSRPCRGGEAPPRARQVARGPDGRAPPGPALRERRAHDPRPAPRGLRGRRPRARPGAARRSAPRSSRVRQGEEARGRRGRRRESSARAGRATLGPPREGPWRE